MKIDEEVLRTRTWHEGHAADYIRELSMRNDKKLSVRAIEQALLLDKRCPTREECRSMVLDGEQIGNFAHLGELLSGRDYGRLR